MAHTIRREMRTEQGWQLDYGQASTITVPTLLLVGSDSPDHVKGSYQIVAEALPDARVAILEGQQHVAHLVAPDLFADEVIRFLRQS